MDRHNLLRETLESGGVALGTQSKTKTAMAVEVFGELGVDFVWIDLEHSGPSPYDSLALENLNRAANLSGTELFVRVPSHPNPAIIRKILDTGVRNILVPRVQTADEVREIVKASRFAYDGEPGERGVAGGALNNWAYPEWGTDAYAVQEDSEVLIGVMVEHAAAVENIDEILQVPDLGFIFIGPGDLCVSLGYPLEIGHPAVQDAVEHVRDACLDAGVPVGRVYNDMTQAKKGIEEGYQILRIGGELKATRQVIGERLSVLRDE